jgi:hypothetical protein
LSITYWGGPTPEEDSCPSSATWIVTATDELGASSSMSGTCPPKPPGWPSRRHSSTRPGHSTPSGPGPSSVGGDSRARQVGRPAGDGLVRT